MNRKRLLSLGIAWVGAFTLVLIITLTYQVQGANSQGAEDSELEADKALVYEQDLTASWPSSETFSAGAWLEALIAQPGITLSKTVGTDPNTCATGSNISVPQGTNVTYCYEVMNTGDITLTVHELDDSELGTILTGFPYTLAAGASAFLTVTTNIVTDTTNVATWTACNIDGPPSLTCFDSAAFDVVSSTATANVTILPPPTSVSLNTFTGGSNPISRTAMIGLLALLVFAALFFIRRIQSEGY